MTSPAIAVITVVHGRADHLRRQRHLLATRAPRPLVHVVVAMGDKTVRRHAEKQATPLRTHLLELPADPARLPLAAARNAGAAAALEDGAETLVFLDVDCLPGPQLLARYAAAVRRRPDALLAGPVGYLPPRTDSDYPVEDSELDRLAVPSAHRPIPAADDIVDAAGPELFWSLSFAMSRSAWLSSGGFCIEYEGYGAEDTDFAMAAAARGHRLAWVGRAWAWHQDHGPSGPIAAHVEDIVRNAIVFHDRWNVWPMAGWLDHLSAEGVITRDADGRPAISQTSGQS